MTGQLVLNADGVKLQAGPRSLLQGVLSRIVAVLVHYIHVHRWVVQRSPLLTPSPWLVSPTI